MTTALAISCLLAALLIGWPLWFPDVLGLRSGSVLKRLSHFVPAWVHAGGADDVETRHLSALHRVLGILDPTFPAFERALRSIGVAGRAWSVVMEIGKLLCAVLCGAAAALFWGRPASFVSLSVLMPIVTGLAVIVFINQMTERTAIARRRRVRSELALATEMFSIFLEGGQTLDQAFRNFGDMCGQALPHVAAVQRALVVDLNNGISYEKAIARWAACLDVEEAKPLAALFTESLLHGTELVSHLRQISADLVEARILAARASIGVKSAQLTAVMVAFFLPAILAFVAAPAAVALVKTFGSMR